MPDTDTANVHGQNREALQEMILDYPGSFISGYMMEYSCLMGQFCHFWFEYVAVICLLGQPLKKFPAATLPLKLQSGKI